MRSKTNSTVDVKDSATVKVVWEIFAIRSTI